MLSVFALGAVIVLLWVLFYIFTVRMIRQNMRLQATTGAEAITYAVEEELLNLEDAVYDISHQKGVSAIAASSNPRQFYAAGAAFLDEHPVLPGNIKSDDHVAVFNRQGLFYRLKGNIPNTALHRIYYLCESGENRTLTVAANNTTYIGVREEIYADNGKCGYAVLLTDMGRIRRILEAYNDLEDLSVALLSGEQVLCSNREIRYEDLEALSKGAIFANEKEIGLSGYRLFVCCGRGISRQVAASFRLVLPVTILILLGIVLLERKLYRSELSRRETELEMERSLLSLLKKQISAHFTVNTLNVVRAMIKKGEKAPAARICDELSALLRYANAGEEYISLMEEFYILQQYVGIMQARFPGRIEAEFDEENFPDEVYIPRMLIQPVVENAIQHGLGKEGGKISVNAVRNGDEITVCVSDNGRGMNEAELDELVRQIHDPATDRAHDLSHVALRNIERRIHMVCGERYGLEIRSESGKGTQVSIRLPASPK